MSGSAEELWQKAVLQQRRIPLGTGVSGAMCDRWALGRRQGAGALQEHSGATGPGWCYPNWCALGR